MENEKPQETKATRGVGEVQPPRSDRGSHHGLRWALPQPVPPRPKRIVLCLPWIICFGLIGLLFASSHDFVWPILHAFLLSLGSIQCKSEIKT